MTRVRMMDKMMVGAMKSGERTMQSERSAMERVERANARWMRDE